MNWKPANLVFEGGTEAARALYGRRVRVRRALSPNQFLGDGQPAGPPATLAAGRIGFVGHPVRDELVLAFATAGDAPSTLKAMMNKPFLSVIVNWPTLRAQFDIES